MRKWMETNVPRRLLSLALSAAMVLSLLPMPSSAAEGDGLCAHHTEHTAECGYVEAVAGQPCGHVCGDDCFTLTTACNHVHGAECYSDGVLPAGGEEKAADACAHVCTEESGCVTKTPACVHTAHEGCGYVEAVEGKPCTYHCEICTQQASQNLPEPCVHGNAPDNCPVCPVQSLIDALPEDVTAETRDAVQSALAEVDRAKTALTVEEQGLLHMDRYTALRELLEAPISPEPPEPHTGWVEEDGNWYYLVDGVKQTGWQNSIPGYEGKWLYFDPATGAMQTGWRNDIPGYEGKWIYFDPATGAMQTDLQGGVPDYVDTWYYLDPATGGLQTGGVQSQSQSSTFNGSPAEVDATGNLLINENNFPDGNFRGIVADYDTDNDGSLSTSEVEVVTDINCSTMAISDLKGIEYFTALTKLSCSDNPLTTLDVGKNTHLKELTCDRNILTSLDVSGNTKLILLSCNGNNLTSLDVRVSKALELLSCNNNQLASLDVSQNTALIELHCSINQLKELDVSQNRELTHMECGYNQLKTLDVSNHTALTKLICNNQEVAGEYVPLGSKYLLNLGELVGSDNLKWVSVTSGGSLDSTTGMVTLDAPVNGKATFKYNYNTQNGIMDVTLTLTAHTHSFDDRGNCSCGLVKQVPYVDAKGSSLGTQVCAVITKDTKTLTGGWYVASGNLTVWIGESHRCKGDANLILEDGCNLIIDGGAIDVPIDNSLTIYAQSTGGGMGKLSVLASEAAFIDSESYGAGIGGRNGAMAGSITINGGIITTAGTRGSAGIGSGGNGGGGSVTINGGIITAFGADGGAGIGSGDYGGGCSVTINGGIVTATGGAYRGAGIGNGNNGRNSTFSTGTNGNAVIFASSISDNSSQSDWSGVIFEGGAGKVYGSPTLSLGLPIPDGKSLTLDMDGKSLTFAQGTGITLNSGSTLILSGPGTFPGGISITGGTLAELLPSGWAFTRNGIRVPVSDETSLSGAIGLRKITVTITGQPSDVAMTYGESESLSVTAEPTTSGEPVSYQWYQNDTALTGQTGSTLPLSTLNAGSHQIYCAVTCNGFTVNSKTATVTITPKEVSLTVTIKTKAFDGTTTAEIDTVNTSDIVAGDDVQVVNGTPSFTQKTPGETIPVTFTEFKLDGEDKDNYQLTQPTGVTGSIRPSGRYLNLEGKADFAGHTEVWVDGVAYPIQTDDGRYVTLPEAGNLLTIYTYQSGDSALSHQNYPTGMAVYHIVRSDGGATVEEIGELNDLLQYSGCSIRVTGKRGIRMITSLTKENKKALKGAGLAGFTLEEYGTVVQWADTLGAESLTLANGKSNFAYSRERRKDPVFATSGELTQYTNVLVDFTLDECKKDIVLRPYIILKDADGQTITLYGGCVSRSIGYIAYQNRTGVFKPGTAAYRYVWEIIHAVYGTQYDSEYQG